MNSERVASIIAAIRGGKTDNVEIPKYLRTNRYYSKFYKKTLKTIAQWMKWGLPLDDPDATAKALADRPNTNRGRKPKGIQKEETTAPGEEPMLTKDDIAKALLREKVRRERIKADLESGKAVLVAEIEVPLGALLASIQNGIDSFPDRAAPMVQGFTDVPEISRILHGEMQATVGQLAIFDFERALDGTPAEIRAEVEAALRRIGNFRTEQTTKPTT